MPTIDDVVVTPLNKAPKEGSKVPTNKEAKEMDVGTLTPKEEDDAMRKFQRLNDSLSILYIDTVEAEMEELQHQLSPMHDKV